MKPKLIKPLAFIFLIAIIVITLTTFNVSSWEVSSIRDWIASFGLFASIIFIAVYAVAPVLLIPASLLSLAAGALFGPGLGTIYVLIGATLGATNAFITSRYFSSGFHKKIEGNKKFNLKKLNANIESHGLTYIIILRLIPIIPYTLLNYALGITKVRLRDFIIGSFIGMIPGVFVYVFLGSALYSLNTTQISIAVLLFTSIIVIPIICSKWRKKK